MKDKIDIVVGICTKNVEDTIEGVIKVVDRGLNDYFPEKKSLIIVSDGFSKDRTKERANQAVTRTEKIVLDQIGKIGKGNGVKTIFIKAKEVGAEDGSFSRWRSYQHNAGMVKTLDSAYINRT